jgi:NAD(P)-dependent dehydrogenase (short-subunit alcohol dehydrogenase family)
MKTPPLTWFITGTSQGIGLELVQAALDRGDNVVATSRQPDAVASKFPSAGARLLALGLDLSSSASAETAVERTLATFGRIDVLVNNAGFGVVGAVEEADDAEIARVIDINLLGLLRVTRAVLPVMRRQRDGHIVNLSSISGLVGMPGFGIYNLTKFGVEGLSEALAAEVNPLGIRVTIVEPGPFRTDFLGGSLAPLKRVIDDYAETAGKMRASSTARHGNQPGDPARAAQAIITAVTAKNPPLHLLLGGFAFARANQKLTELHAEYDAWKETTLGADF